MKVSSRPAAFAKFVFLFAFLTFIIPNFALADAN